MSFCDLFAHTLMVMAVPVAVAVRGQMWVYDPS
jgi:hypothetical protein